MKYLKKTFASIHRWTPVASFIGYLHYLVNACVPALIALITASLLTCAERILGGAPQQGRLYALAAALFAVHLVSNVILHYAGIAMNASVFEKVTANARIELYEKTAKLPLISFEDAELMNQKERAEKAVRDERLTWVFMIACRIAYASITIISVAAVLTSYSLWLLPLSVLSVLPYVVARIVRGKEFYSTRKAQAKRTRLQGYLWGLFTQRQSAKEMRVMGFGGYIMDKWSAVRDEVSEELWAVEKKDAISLLLCDGFRIVCYGLSIFVVLMLALRGQIGLGVFGASLAAFLSMQSGMRDFLRDIGLIGEYLAYAKDYFTFLELPEERDGGAQYAGLREKIELRAVSFQYPASDKFALKDINLTIGRGERVAILGVNGSGKTTLSKVLLGLYPPGHGQVLYDGAPQQSFSRGSFYAKISAIAQDFTSYSLSVRENVAISDVSRLDDDAGMRAALSDAGIAEIGQLDDALGREFGGRELSGGQWQKLAIARGLFKRSDLILLDEPTSALDPLVETEILTKFIEAAGGKTALIISHRVGLCKLVDRIIVMKDGRIAEDGGHEELLGRGGEYARLFGEQAKWYGQGA